MMTRDPAVVPPPPPEPNATTAATTSPKNAPSAAPESAAPPPPPPTTTTTPAQNVGGELYTWGRGSAGQLGQNTALHPSPNCALPHPVALPSIAQGLVIAVSCGGGQQGCTAAVTATGQLFTFGSNFQSRLGHGGCGGDLCVPRLVRGPLVGLRVTAVAAAEEHMLCIIESGAVFAWGSNRYGCLGLGDRTPRPTPTAVDSIKGVVVAVDADNNASAALLASGGLLMWGRNAHGRLGVGDTVDRAIPTLVNAPGRGGGLDGIAETCTSDCGTEDAGGGGVAAHHQHHSGTRDSSTAHTASPPTAPAFQQVSVGSLYTGAIAPDGSVWTWGYGGHGNLGHGTRKSRKRPSKILALATSPVAQITCTRGQNGCKGGLHPTAGGHEGPHTMVVAVSGELYTFGTCHKGLLANLGGKTGAFGEPWDELLPYRVGSAIRNRGNNAAPLSPMAAWPPPYDRIGPIRQAVSAHIHAAVVTRSGEAWAWGCGSNDGRCGVERFLNMRGDGAPPQVDAMKCYMMGPHRIGVARQKYWGFGPSLEGRSVIQLASSRNHMAAIIAPLPDRCAGAGNSVESDPNE